MSAQLVAAGTATGHGPLDRVSVTVEPCCTPVPAAGLRLITPPADTVLLHTVFCWHTRLAATIAAQFVAAGTITGHQPLDKVSVTVEPGCTSVPATGDWLITSSAGTVSLQTVFSAHTRPVASISSQLVASGTITALGHDPLDRDSVTVEPGMAIVPAAGDWLITCPAATVSLQTEVVLHTKPAFVMSVQLVAVGTATGQGPLDRVRVTVEPGMAIVPAAGD